MQFKVQFEEVGLAPAAASQTYYVWKHQAAAGNLLFSMYPHSRATMSGACAFRETGLISGDAIYNKMNFQPLKFLIYRGTHLIVGGHTIGISGDSVYDIKKTVKDLSQIPSFNQGIVTATQAAAPAMLVAPVVTAAAETAAAAARRAGETRADARTSGVAAALAAFAAAGAGAIVAFVAPPGPASAAAAAVVPAAHAHASTGFITAAYLHKTIQDALLTPGVDVMITTTAMTMQNIGQAAGAADVQGSLAVGQTQAMRTRLELMNFSFTSEETDLLSNKEYKLYRITLEAAGSVTSSLSRLLGFGPVDTKSGWFNFEQNMSTTYVGSQFLEHQLSSLEAAVSDEALLIQISTARSCVSALLQKLDPLLMASTGLLHRFFAELSTLSELCITMANTISKTHSFYKVQAAIDFSNAASTAICYFDSLLSDQLRGGGIATARQDLTKLAWKIRDLGSWSDNLAAFFLSLPGAPQVPALDVERSLLHSCLASLVTQIKAVEMVVASLIP